MLLQKLKPQTGVYHSHMRIMNACSISNTIIIVLYLYYLGTGNFMPWSRHDAAYYSTRLGTIIIM